VVADSGVEKDRLRQLRSQISRSGRQALEFWGNQIGHGFESRPELRRRLPAIWARLLQEEAIEVLEILDDESGERVAFGVAAMLSDECAVMMRTRRTPHSAADILEREDQASQLARSTIARPPWILRPKDIRVQNHPRHGLTFCLLHYFELMLKSPREDILVVRGEALMKLVETQRGYFLKELLFETYGEDDRDFIESMGCHVRTGYELYYAEKGLPLPKLSDRPLMVGVTSEEILPGRPVYQLFNKRAPRIFFTLRQQSVLTRAARKPMPTDDDIAAELGISGNRVRSIWRGIYHAVYVAQTVGRLADGYPFDPQQSGTQKRRAVLAFVTDNPVELRPVHRTYFRPCRDRLHGFVTCD
jgi:hypothetical protein